MHEVSYSQPTTVDEAVGLLAEHAQNPRVLAGGTDLLIQMRGGTGDFRHLVDVKRIPEMNVLQVDADEGLRLGGGVSCALLTEHPTARRLYPGLVEAAALIGSTQIQNRATIAGNLCNGSPAADTTPALLALAASCIIAGPDGRREVPADAFLTAPGRTTLEPGELLVAIEAAAPGPGGADAYQRFTPRNEMDIAVVGVGMNLTLDDGGTCTAARVALGAVGPRATLAEEAARALIGTKLEADDLARAGALASSAAQPISDKRGPAEFRREITGVLLRRVAEQAAQRCRERT